MPRIRQLYDVKHTAQRTRFAIVAGTDQWPDALHTDEPLRCAKLLEVHRMTERSGAVSAQGEGTKHSAWPQARRYRRAWGAAAISIALWAAAFPAIRVAVTSYPPATLTAARLLVASLALAVAAPVLGLTRPRLRDLPLIVVSGLLGMAGYQLLLNWGEQSVSAATATLIVATSPAYSVLLAAAVLRERLTHRRATGISVAIAGAAVIALGQDGPLHLDFGSLLVLGAALAYGSYHVAHRPLLSRYTAATVTCYATWAATLLTAPLFAAIPTALAEADINATAATVFLGIGPSAIAFATWAYAVHRLGVAPATTALYLTPAVALPLSAAWLGELPHLIELIGGILALSGVTIANRKRHRPASRNESH
jgi:drug/metabolite transporter (DMT)-like permease